MRPPTISPSIEAVTVDQQQAYESTPFDLHFHPEILPPVLGSDPMVVQSASALESRRVAEVLEIFCYAFGVPQLRPVLEDGMQISVGLVYDERLTATIETSLRLYGQTQRYSKGVIEDHVV